MYPISSFTYVSNFYFTGSWVTSLVKLPISQLKRVLKTAVSTLERSGHRPNKAIEVCRQGSILWTRKFEVPGVLCYQVLRWSFFIEGTNYALSLVMDVSDKPQSKRKLSVDDSDT